MTTQPEIRFPGRFIVNPDFNIYVETFGDPSRPVILFTHGAFQSSKCWRKQVQELSKQWFVITWDLPFHGLSGPYELGENGPKPGESIMAKSMHRVVEEFHLRERGFVQVAWSMGGTVTSDYLLTHGSQGFRGLILVGSLLDWFGLLPKFQPLIDSFFSEQQDVRTAAISQFLNSLCYQPPSLDDYLLTVGYNMQACLRSINFLPFMLIDEKCSVVLRQQECPVLWIQGVHDALLPSFFVKEDYHAWSNGRLLEYEECGHSPFLEYPERFNQDVHDFLTETMGL